MAGAAVEEVGAPLHGQPVQHAEQGVQAGTGCPEYCHLILCVTASPKVMKIFSHPQTRNQSQVVQNDKLSRENVETKIFVGGKGTFSHFLEKKLKKI